jgi:tRNA modification GTPase
MSNTIAAIATPPGRGGVGIVRISGNKALAIAEIICHKKLKPRLATFSQFYAAENILDQGIVLYFPGPNSFTGEDVIELQAHGSPYVLDQLLQEIFRHGARIAEPGEFSKRSYLNNKINLNEAEAIADLIHAESARAARSAIYSLRGDFAKQVFAIRDKLRNIRIFLEASLDFSDEEIGELTLQQYINLLRIVCVELEKLNNTATQGKLLNEGIKVILAGAVNAGKSSLLNYLCAEDVAIVSEEEGTTRDMIRALLHIEGIPIYIMDTAGMRETSSKVEQEGQRRAREAIASSDIILWVRDCRGSEDFKFAAKEIAGDLPILFVHNKIDLLDAALNPSSTTDAINISTKTGVGIAELKKQLVTMCGAKDYVEGTFIARRRHCEALAAALSNVREALLMLESGQYPECAAESCALAQVELDKITGGGGVEDLLDGIFSEFCIGK